jgi:glycosyltransferase involved in cell wall biosynthesis
MLRILYVTDSLMAGGIESQLMELVTHLHRDRYDPHVLCLYGPTERSLHYAPDLQAADVPFQSLDLGWSWRDKIVGIQSIIATVHRLRPDIIQAEGYHANLLTRLAAPYLRHMPLIGSVRGLHSKKQLLYERISHRFCKRLVVNAAHLKEMLIKGSSIPANKIVVIPNGITLDRYAIPHETDLRQKLAPNSRRILISIGRISFEKNMHWLIEAMGLLREWRRLPEGTQLWIIGPVQHQAAQDLLQDSIARYGLEDVVTQFPQTLYPQDFYYTCDACILFSPAEGLANVAIESLVAGRPLVISSSANAANVIIDRQTGWVVPTADTVRLAETLAEVLILPDDTLQRIQQQCRLASKYYSTERMVAEYEEFYMTF